MGFGVHTGKLEDGHAAFVGLQPVEGKTCRVGTPNGADVQG